MSAEQDNILFAKIKHGDKGAFDQLFKKHYSRLCNFARGIFRVDDLSEETVQEVFINLWEGREKINVTKSVIAFLYTCVRNHAYNKIEKEKTRKLYEEKYVRKKELHTELEFVDEGEVNTITKILKQAIDTLPRKCKDIFFFFFYEGLTYEEISVFLDISVKTVENQMGIAFQKLRAEVVPRYNES